MKNKFPESAGFTLIELLVVISIISLLMSITVPAIRKVKQSSQRVACRANLRSISIGLRSYLNDNRNILPTAAEMHSLEPTIPPITAFIFKRLQDPKVFQCPSDNARVDVNLITNKSTTYYEGETTSYLYSHRVCGLTVNKIMTIGNPPRTRQVKASDLEVMYDYQPFHGTAQKVGAKNYLYADLHVGDVNAK